VRDAARHDLLTVAPAAWGPLLAQRPDLDGIPHLADWAARGWPVIVRRRGPGEDGTLVPAGLPLPPSLGKRRIGLTLPPAALRPPLGSPPSTRSWRTGPPMVACPGCSVVCSGRP
jgi:phosphoribosyl-dephospho-CoA transferase